MTPQECEARMKDPARRARAEDLLRKYNAPLNDIYIDAIAILPDSNGEEFARLMKGMAGAASASQPALQESLAPRSAARSRFRVHDRQSGLVDVSSPRKALDILRGDALVR